MEVSRVHASAWKCEVAQTGERDSLISIVI
nr:MAG TPA: hypothetical protein [Caudoviricetes sp.]